MTQEKEYFAFISYKREDERWAKWLQHKLEHYKLPSNLNGRTDLPHEIRPVFRDVSDLAPGLLAEEIYTALRSSQWLIIICSPRSAKSPWVCKEAQTFINLGRADHIIPFIIEGVPFSTDLAEECFPQALRNLTGSDEILGSSVNEMGGRDAAAVKVIARMFCIRFDTLWKRDERERKRKRTIFIIAAALVVFAVLGVALYTWNQNVKLNRSVSRAAAGKAEQLVEEGDSYLARKIAMEAIDKAYTPEAESVLRKAWDKDNAVLRGHNRGVHYSAFSPDGKNIVSASSDSTIRIWDVVTGQCLRVLKGHTCWVYCAKYSPDGRFVASASGDSTIRIWDASTGICLHKKKHIRLELIQ